MDWAGHGVGASSVMVPKYSEAGQGGGSCLPQHGIQIHTTRYRMGALPG